MPPLEINLAATLRTGCIYSVRSKYWAEHAVNPADRPHPRRKSSISLASAHPLIALARRALTRSWEILSRHSSRLGERGLTLRTNHRMTTSRLVLASRSRAKAPRRWTP